MAEFAKSSSEPTEPLSDLLRGLTNAVNIQTTWSQAQDDKLRRIHFWIRLFGVVWLSSVIFASAVFIVIATR